MKKLVLLTIVFAMVMVLSSSVVAQEQSSKCSVEVSGESGLFSSYNGGDVGETFYRPRVVQTWVEVEVCGNKRVSAGLNLWNSLSTKENPSGGTEFDTVGFVKVKLDEKTSVRFEGGTFFVPDGKIHKASASISTELKLTEKVNGYFSNSTSVFRVSESLGFRGGVVNKTSLTVSKNFFKDKVTLSVTPAIGVDNNPFNLGDGKVAVMGFASGRMDVPINSKLSFVVGGIISNPIAGDTDRGFRKWGSVGIAFKL